MITMFGRFCARQQKPVKTKSISAKATFNCIFIVSFLIELKDFRNMPHSLAARRNAVRQFKIDCLPSRIL
jgi:hypothetical protein